MNDTYLSQAALQLFTEYLNDLFRCKIPWDISWHQSYLPVDTVKGVQKVYARYSLVFNVVNIAGNVSVHKPQVLTDIYCEGYKYICYKQNQEYSDSRAKELAKMRVNKFWNEYFPQSVHKTGD